MTRTTERLLWGVAGFCTVLALVIARAGHVETAAPLPTTALQPPELMTFDEARVAADADSAIEHDPFRLERRPADVTFGTPTTALAALPPSPPIQGITLKGVVGGPPWQAILSGVPGRQGSVVVHAGDTLAGGRVRQVRRDAIVFAGPDSAVTLPLHRSWP